MAEIRDELILDIDSALAAIDRLERDLNTSLGDVPIGVDIDDSAIRDVQTRLDSLSIDVDDTSLQSLDDRFSEVERSAAEIVSEVERIEAAANAADADFTSLARVLGVSADEARDLADNVVQSSRRAADAEDAARDLARQLGLSADEADDFARAMRRAANDVDDADRRAGSLRSNIAQIGSVVGGLAVGAAAFQALRFGIDQAAQALDQYTSLSESVNAVNVVFEEGAATVLEFGQTAATSVGLAAAEFNQLLVPIGAQLRNFGFDAETAGEQAVILGQRAADLASVYNTDVTEALGAIQAALRGEGDPIERFGASVSAARVEAFALANGLAATKGEIDDQIKLQARLGLILADINAVAGDFANTSDGLANRQRILSARFRDTQAAVGEALVPAYESLLDLAPAVLETFENLVPVLNNAVAGFLSLSDAGDGVATGALARLPAIFSGIQGGLGTLFDVGAGASDVLSGLFDALTLNFEGIGDQADQFGQRFQNVFERIAVQGFISQISQGATATQAFGDSVLFLSRQDTLAPDALINGLQRLITVAGLSESELNAVAQSLINNADTYDLTAQEVAELERVLFRLPDAFDTAETARFERALSSAADAVQRANAAAQEAPSAFDQFAAAAEAAGVSVETLAGSADPLARALFDALDPATQLRLRVDGLRSGAIDAAEAFDDRLGDAIRSLPGLLNEVSDDIDQAGQQVLDNIREQATAQANFEANLARLVLAGQTATANIIRGLDPSEAAAAAQALVNELDLANEAEAILTGQDQEIAALVADTLDVADLISQELNASGIAAVAEFAAGLESPEARRQVEDAIDLLLTALNLREIDIPVRFTVEGGFQVPVPDRLEPDTGTGTGTTFSGTADRPVVNFGDTIINNPVSQNIEEEVAVLQQQIGTAAALLSQ